MGVFRTDYQDAVWTGDRQYTISGTGTNQTITDTTTYEPAGDQIGAEEMNNIGAELNKIANIVSVPLPAENWSNSAPYSQTVSVAGMLATDNPIVSLNIISTDTTADIKGMRKTFALIDYAQTAAGQITFYCKTKKPTDDCRLALKGVSEE